MQHAPLDAPQKGAYVITGAGSGIGRNLTEQLLARGDAVSAWDIEPGDLRESNDPNLLVYRLDTRDEAAVKRAAQETLERFGAISALSATAGIFRPKPFLELTEDDWDQHFSINLKGVLLSVQAVLPAMRARQKGSIVLWASGLGRTPVAGTSHYAATKGGVYGLMRSLALETARDGVRVNCISPGIADTPMPNAVYDRSILDLRATANPLGRIGTAQDMANAALFLMDEENSYMTGQDIRVNGGVGLF